MENHRINSNIRFSVLVTRTSLICVSFIHKMRRIWHFVSFFVSFRFIKNHKQYARGPDKEKPKIRQTDKQNTNRLIVRQTTRHTHPNSNVEIKPPNIDGPYKLKPTEYSIWSSAGERILVKYSETPLFHSAGTDEVVSSCLDWNIRSLTFANTHDDVLFAWNRILNYNF